MKIGLSGENQYVLEQTQKQVDLQLNDRFAVEQKMSGMMYDRDAILGKSKSTNEILSLKEMTTLHMLFGSEKPNELTFYGRNNVHQVQKGHLLDVVG